MSKQKTPTSLTDLWNKDGSLPEQHRPKRKQKPKSKDEEVDIESLLIPLPKEDPGFFEFCRWWAFPKFKGLYGWQKEHHDATWDAEYEMTLVPRDHGKSVEYTQKYQWAMWYKGFDVLLLGWTDRRKEVALNTYAFFYKRDLIDRDKRTSHLHFRLKNGGKFDCYLISSKETLGMHSLGKQARFENIDDKEWKRLESLYKNEDETFDKNALKTYLKEQKLSERNLWISIDDPIDISFMKETHKEKDLEMRFDSSLYPIHPAKWSFTGTHKFEGDFFDFIKRKFSEDLVVYKKGTMRENGTPLCPEKFTHPDLPTYKIDLLKHEARLVDDKIKPILKKGKRIKKTPKLDLAKLRHHVGEYAWWSEYEQDPHPITGDVWDHIKTVDLLEEPINRKYDTCWISIDRATTQKKTSSYTGCIIGLRHMITGHRTITHDWTSKITLEELLIKVNNFIIEFRKKYENIRIVLIIEKQGGGDDFIEMGRSRRYFLHEGKQIENKIGILCEIIPLHNVGEKKQRIHDRLYLPIKNELIGLMSTLEHSELKNEILKFPYFPKLDGIDALANAEYELQKIPLYMSEDPFLQIVDAYLEFENRNKKPWETLTPQEKEREVRAKIGKGSRRNIFDDW